MNQFSCTEAQYIDQNDYEINRFYHSLSSYVLVYNYGYNLIDYTVSSPVFYR